MSYVMILLVGEQPAPNLLPLRHYDPARVALVHTELTYIRARRLAEVIKKRVVRPFCKTEAFKVDEIKTNLLDYLADHEWSGDRLLFNLTSGTKPMMIAAYEIARQMGARAFYYQTQGNLSMIHPYRFVNGKLMCDSSVSIEATLTLDDYLRLYAGKYIEPKPKDRFEKMVVAALRSNLPEYEFKTSVWLQELAGSVEVDLLARCGNQVAAFEIKQRAGKKGIDQLNGVTDQRTLGTYTRKILVSAAPIDENNLDLAYAHRIHPVVLPSGLEKKRAKLAEKDVQQLIETVRKVLEPKP